jgi:hypothetical protein
MRRVELLVEAHDEAHHQAHDAPRPCHYLSHDINPADRTCRRCGYQQRELVRREHRRIPFYE